MRPKVRKAMGGYSLLPALRNTGPVERPAVLSGLHMPSYQVAGVEEFVFWLLVLSSVSCSSSRNPLPVHGSFCRAKPYDCWLTCRS